MAGIYIHIPFCRKACHYCDFHFSTGLAQRRNMVDALRKELQLRADTETYGPLETVYFGGGTPSLLESGELGAILEDISTLWGIASDAEITLEANPDDLSPSKLQELRSMGVNRLSIGVQSFDQRQLASMNRSHNSDQSLGCLQDAIAAGFENISADLIFALPGLSDQQLSSDARRLVDLKIPHVSAYCLTIEEGTVLHHQVAKGRVAETEDGVARDQFMLLDSLLGDSGYEHYEVSNYALPDRRSKHNSAYWNGIPFIGIGPSAHGFDGASRYWNVRNNGVYMRKMKEGTLASELETLSVRDGYNEYIMTHLRKTEGIDTAQIMRLFSVDMEADYQSELDQLTSKQWLLKQGSTYRMSKEGWFLSDRVASDLFWVES